MKDYSTLIEKLTQRFELERIYHFSYPFMDEEKQHLLLVMGVKGTMSPNVMQPMVKLSLAEDPGLSFSIVPYGEWKNNLHMGCLFFVQAARQKNLLHHGGKKKLAPFTVSDLNGVNELVNSIYPSAKNQSEEFMKGVYFYLEEGNPLQATFMLYQAAEVRLKSLIQVLLGRTNAIHSIQQFIKALSKYIPEFQYVFRKDYEYDLRMLQLLDKAYTTVRRNGNSFEIEEEDLTYLRKKVGKLCSTADGIFEHMSLEIGHMIQEAEKELHAIEPEECAPALTESKRIVNDLSSFAMDRSIKKQLNRILDSIEKDHPIEQILLIRSEVSTFAQNGLYIQDKADHLKKAEFFVLAVTKEDIKMAYVLKEMTDVNVTVLFYTKKAVIKALGKASRFITEIYQRNVVLRQSAECSTLCSSKEINWSEIHDKILNEWQIRKERIDGWSRFFELNRLEPMDMIRYTFAGLAIEQMCIAWLRCGTGYLAHRGTVGFMIDLTKMTSPALYQLLYPKSESEKTLMRKWVNYNRLWRAKAFHNLDSDFGSTLVERCKDAYELTCKYCEAELQKLKIRKEAYLAINEG